MEHNEKIKCPSCDKEINILANLCIHCRVNLIQHRKDHPLVDDDENIDISTQIAPNLRNEDVIQTEKVFYDYGNVRVTNARFINGANHYKMSDITSIKLIHKNPEKIGFIFHILCVIFSFRGAFILFDGLIDGEFKNIIEGLFIMIFCGGCSFAVHMAEKLKKTIHIIMLSTSKGEIEGLRSEHIDYVSEVTKSLNDAFVFRDWIIENNEKMVHK
jgi:hypothetical protein